MNNIIVAVQRFLKNKNIVTVLGVVIILVLLYFGYSSQINNAVQPQQIPVAAETIQPRTEITEDMVTLVDMPSISITDNVITNKNMIVGKYTNVNSVIPAGSMFYKDTVIEETNLPDSVFLKVKKGEMIYQFAVNMETTFGNSIYPGNYIDIYMKIGDGDDEKIMLGKLIENIQVLAVRDSSGKDVFENTSESRQPAYLLFGLPEDINLLLQKASYMSSLGVTLYPIPHSGTMTVNGATELSTQQLVDYIEAHAVNLPSTSTSTTETDKLIPTVKTSGTNPVKVTIKYPSGCGSKYTCNYVLGSSRPVTVTKTSQSVTVSSTTDLTVTLTEKDGTIHTATETITVSENASGSTNVGGTTNNTSNTTASGTTTNTNTTTDTGR